MKDPSINKLHPNLVNSRIKILGARIQSVKHFPESSVVRKKIEKNWPIYNLVERPNPSTHALLHFAICLYVICSITPVPTEQWNISIKIQPSFPNLQNVQEMHVDLNEGGEGIISSQWVVHSSPWFFTLAFHLLPLGLQLNCIVVCESLPHTLDSCQLEINFGFVYALPDPHFIIKNRIQVMSWRTSSSAILYVGGVL